jgi:hypothetical protein
LAGNAQIKRARAWPIYACPFLSHPFRRTLVVQSFEEFCHVECIHVASAQRRRS